MIKGVIFDMDGVLILSADAHYRSWRDVAARHGVEVPYEKFLKTFGRTNPDIIRLWWGEGVSRELLGEIAEEKEREFRAIIHTDVPLAPGCVELLEGVRDAGMPMAVGSSAPPENIELVLRAGRIGAYFTALVDGSEVKRGKPEPDVFLLAAKKLGLPASECVVVEDAPAGIAAAVAAGAVPIGIAATHGADELRAAGAVHVLPSLADLTPAAIAIAAG